MGHMGPMGPMGPWAGGQAGGRAVRRADLWRHDQKSAMELTSWIVLCLLGAQMGRHRWGHNDFQQKNSCGNDFSKLCSKITIPPPQFGTQK